MPSIEPALSGLSHSMEDPKVVAQMLADSAASLRKSAAAEAVLQNVEAQSKEGAATLGTVIDELV